MESISTFEIWLTFFKQLWPVWLALAITFTAIYQWRARLGVLGRIFDSPVGLVGLLIVLFWVFSAIFADIIVLFDSLEQSGLYRRKPPGTMNVARGIPYIFGRVFLEITFEVPGLSRGGFRRFLGRLLEVPEPFWRSRASPGEAFGGSGLRSVLSEKIFGVFLRFRCILICFGVFAEKS